MLKSGHARVWSRSAERDVLGRCCHSAHDGERMTRVMLDCNIYDKLSKDAARREIIAPGVACARLAIIATPVLVGELVASPFGGIPDVRQRR